MNKEGKVVFIGKIICTYYKNGICSAPWTIENCPLKAYKCKLKKRGESAAKASGLEIINLDD